MISSITSGRYKFYSLLVVSADAPYSEEFLLLMDFRV
jgi:hypothetical protein